MAQRGDEFWIEIQDIRHCVEDEGDTLTLLWVLEGRAELNTDVGRDILEANTLATSTVIGAGSSRAKRQMSPCA